MSKVRVCTACGAPVQRDAGAFCTFCGAELPPKPVPPGPRDLSTPARFEALHALPEANAALRSKPKLPRQLDFDDGIGSAMIMVVLPFTALGLVIWLLVGPGGETTKQLGWMLVFVVIAVWVPSALIAALTSAQTKGRSRSKSFAGRFRIVAIESNQEGFSDKPKLVHRATLEDQDGKRITLAMLSREVLRGIGPDDMGVGHVKRDRLVHFERFDV